MCVAVWTHLSKGGKEQEIISYGRNVCKIEKIEIKVSEEREGTIVNKIKSNKVKVKGQNVGGRDVII